MWGGTKGACTDGSRKLVTREIHTRQSRYRAVHSHRRATISLSAQGYTRFSYGATNTELTLEKVNVAVGDHVKKGDILVAFESGEIQKKIED